MRTRGQFVGTLLVIALIVGSGVYLQQRIGPRALADAVPGTSTSGAWFCPHGGGPTGTKEWHATLALANPGSGPVRVRVTELGSEKPAAPTSSVVPPGREVLMSVPADSPGASAFVEYFGGWVSAGWVMRAQGQISGVAAEACTPQASQTWNVADGDTRLPQGARPKQANQTELIVMNPFATDAALSIVVYSQSHPVSTKELTDFVIPSMRSIAVPLKQEILGQQAVGAEVRVSVGRVAAATLTTSFTDGIRSAEGLPGTTAHHLFLPAGSAPAAAELSVSAPAPQGVGLSASLRTEKTQELVSGLQQDSQQGSTAQAYGPTPIDGPSTFDLTATGAGGIAAAVRPLASNVSHDAAATSGTAVANRAWVVPPCATSTPARASLVLFDAGTQDAHVTLTALREDGGAKTPATVTVKVPAGRTVSAPGRFVSADPTSSVLAVSDGPPIVAASAAFSEGQHGVGGSAVATGVIDPRDGEGS